MKKHAWSYEFVALKSLTRLACLTGAMVVLTACGGEAEMQEEETRTPTVTVLEVERSDADLIQEYAGRVRGAREVEVRARIAGVILDRTYQEGSHVEKGDLLFRLDPIPMRIQLRQAEAALANGRAELQQAERDWERAKQLFDRGALSASERDRSRSQVELGRAGVAQAEARVDEAKVNLSYTEVRAPLSGSTSLEVLPEGSLVQPGSLLTNIVRQDPVHVTFALPERDAAIQRAALIEDDSVNGKVSMELPDGAQYHLTGQVDFTSNRIDNATNTISLRAVFDNPEQQLIPGQFVRVRLVLRRFHDQILVPAEAIGANSSGPTVFVVDDESRAELRSVKLGGSIGDLQIITDGLEVGDRLIVNGQVGLDPQTPVNVARPDAATTAANAPGRE
ncbi:hypothetical protein LCGC14_0126520 [marine sediment metagenome]